MKHSNENKVLGIFWDKRFYEKYTWKIVPLGKTAPRKIATTSRVFFWGAILRGTIFVGSIFPGINFPWGNFLVGVFLEGFFLEGIFPNTGINKVIN